MGKTEEGLTHKVNPSNTLKGKAFEDSRHQGFQYFQYSEGKGL